MKVNVLRNSRGLCRTLLVLALALGGATITASAAIEGVSSNALDQIRALLQDKTNRTPAQLKLDSHLLYAARQAAGQPPAPGVPPLALSGLQVSNGRARVDFDAVVSPALLDGIAKLGGVVRSSAPSFNFVQADLPLEQLEAAALLPGVQFIRREVQAITSIGALTSEGDTTHRAAEARAFFNADGSGINVGVLSDSVDFYEQSIASGDLPADLVILPGQDGRPGSGEGTAMLEIVHDLAPGSGLYFATAFGGVGGFAQNIINLRQAGCDVIVDDVFYFSESPFQDGPIAQAVNQVTAEGALFFSSAGNSGSLNKGTSGTWEGDFVDGGAVTAPVDGRGGVVHSFGANNYNVVTQPGFAVTLFWADPLGGSANDYDLFVLDDQGQNIIDSSTTVQNGSQDPYEIAASTAPGQRVVVVKVSGEARFMHIDTIRGRLQVATEGNTKGHSSAAAAFSTAAVDVSTAFPNPFVGGPANPTESFSSDGPRRMFYEANGTPYTPGDFTSTGGIVRQKPDIAAADGNQTTVPGFNPFFGTSAAAPHAAAIAALLKSYSPFLNPTEVRSVFETTALDIEAPGVDRDSGVGIVMAYQALEIAPSGANLVIATNYVIAGNGNGLVDSNECNEILIVLANRGSFGVTNVQARLTTTTPGVIVTRLNSSYPNIPGGEERTNNVPFQISTGDNFPCGADIQFALMIMADQVVTTNFFTLKTGQPGTPLRYDNNIPLPIPDASPLGAESTILVSGFPTALIKATVALHISHTWDADLLIQLISPEGITNTLAANNGGSGDNYGVGCSEGQRTVFDDAAPTPISLGSAPFVGAFRPNQPLVVFSGLLPAGANGAWRLRVVDQAAQDIGTLQCWSLFLTPAQCVDGGGSCPGSDLALGIQDIPDPVTVGSNLTYTITITNNGPRLAKGVVLSQQLPPTAIFSSATITKGTISHGGGIVTGTIGDLGVGATVTATVRVTPIQVGSISSFASVSAVSDVDFDPSNNSRSATTRVDPQLADLALQLVDTPDPVLQGGVLNYAFAVTNNGPSTATGVTLTNLLPSTVTYLGAVPSQGSVTVVSNQVLWLAGPLVKGTKATLNVSVRPLVEGTLLSTAGVAADQQDPIVANNLATAQTLVGPATDLALGLVLDPSSVVVGSNFTASLQITNRGPSTASGVVVNYFLPAGASVVTNTTSQGSVVISNSVLIATLGTLTNGATATVTALLNSTNTGQFATSATVSGSQADPLPANNTASAPVTIQPPFVLVEAAGATLIQEGFQPPNGAVDIGETVTFDFRLRNQGNIPALATTATLQAGDGVVSPSGPQNYGDLPPGGAAVGRTFTFTAAGESGGTVTARLALTANATNQSEVVYQFDLPVLWQFSNTNPIAIPDVGSASNYPSTLTVAGVTGTVGRVVLVLSNLSHTFPQDLDVLLTSPADARTIAMSDGGGTTPASGVTVAFDDQAAEPLSQTAQLVSGAVRPADYEPGDLFAAPAPAGPYVAAMSQFNGLNPNGGWSLFVQDDTPGDQGQIAGGWLLQVYTITPVNQLVDVQVLGSVAPSSPIAGDELNLLFTVTNAGPDTATSVTFTNLLPAELVFVSASASQGAVSHDAGLISGVLGDLDAGETVTVTVAVVAQEAGLLESEAVAQPAETDVNPSNNALTLEVNTAQPVADADLKGRVDAEPIIKGTQVTYDLTVTNLGAETLLDARLTNTLPANLSFVSASTSSGTTTNVGGTVIVALGNLAPNVGATIAIVAQANTSGPVTNLAVVTTASSDPVITNNALTLPSMVMDPVARPVSAGALLTAESQTPPNGSLDPGETVTVQLVLTNAGQLNTTNLVATLLATGGVTAPSAPQNYGAVLVGGPSVSRSFTFTAGTGAGPVVATLQLTDNGANLGQAQFTFALPRTTTLASVTPVSIPELGAAAVYPSVINVAGVTGLVSGVEVTLSNLSHQFPDDLDILLVSPSGARVMLMSDCGGGFTITNRVLTLSDAAPDRLPNASLIVSGSYQPTDYESGDVLPPPAPAGTPAATLAAFNGADPNGQWRLFIADDAAGDAGALAGGWSIVLTTVQPVNPAANLALSGSVSPLSTLLGSPVTYTLNVSNQGPDAAANVTVTNTLPAGFAFVSATAPQGTFTNLAGTVVFTLGDVEAGVSLPVTITATPQVAGQALNQAVVAGAVTDLNPADNVVSVPLFVQSVLPPLLSASFNRAIDQYTVTVEGTPGLTYVIEATSDFLDWTIKKTETAPPSGIIKYIESPASAQSAIYYRAYRAP